MGTKDNMKQAMKELMGMVGVGEDGGTYVAESAEEKETLGENYSESVGRTVDEILGENRPAYAEPEIPVRKVEPVRGPAPDTWTAADAGVTVIASGTSIFGNIQTDGSIDFRGVLKGDLTVKGDIALSGKVLGNVSGHRITMRSSAVQGNITASDLIYVDENSVVIGDTQADALTINGRQKGNLTVEKMLQLQEKAILVGDVMAGLVSMCEGAKVQGAVIVSQRDMDIPEFASLDI